ncbi:MAG: hypothetical protein NVSMB19_12420 [Vulcanimicrobiaceae bacterium]
MNDTSPKLAVIATRMPYIDRRTLSEAWFSALHLASDGPPAVAARDRRTAAVDAAPPTRATPAAAAADPDTRIPGSKAARAAERLRANAEVATRRIFDARVAAAARTKYERARSYPPFRTALTLDAKGERVQLLLRRDGAVLHVIALCRPELAETVRRALACADAHVRLRGEAIRSSVEIVAAGAVTA